MNTNQAEPVKPKPVPEKLGWLANILRHIPYFCSYCGKMYINCHSPSTSVFSLGGNGKCCPDGHEGYTKENMGYYVNINKFDYVKNPPNIEANLEK